MRESMSLYHPSGIEVKLFKLHMELLDHFKGKAYFVDGTTTSGMGIIDYLFDHTDLKFLLIDESPSVTIQICQT